MFNYNQYADKQITTDSPCKLCGAKPSYKISGPEVFLGNIGNDENFPIYGHPLTNYLCEAHFKWVMLHENLRERQLQVFFPNGDFDNEVEILDKLNIRAVNKVAELQPGLLVGRLSAFCEYNLLYDLLGMIGCKLINSPSEFHYIRNFDYYEDIKEFTPETWSYQNFDHCDSDGRFVVRGRWTSAKSNWNSLMFAEDKTKVHEIAGKLNYDTIIGKTGTIVRKYVPLKLLETGINGFPFVNEYRVFCYKDKLLSWGFNFDGVCDKQHLGFSPDGLDLAQEVARIVGNKCSYYVIDVAEKRDGGWIVVELNEGQCSGLSGNNPAILYDQLRTHLGV